MLGRKILRQLVVGIRALCRRRTLLRSSGRHREQPWGASGAGSCPAATGAQPLSAKTTKSAASQIGSPATAIHFSLPTRSHIAAGRKESASFCVNSSRVSPEKDCSSAAFVFFGLLERF